MKNCKAINESINLELNVGKLYTIFQRICKDDYDFWWQLSLEEDNHAALIRSGKQYFAPLDKFPDSLIMKDCHRLVESNKTIEGLIAKYENDLPSREEAFNIALDIEQNAGELHFQKFMEGEDVSAIDKIFRELNGNDIEHADRIRAYMQRNNIEIKQ